jgi:hypothetical protein
MQQSRAQATQRERFEYGFGYILEKIPQNFHAISPFGCRVFSFSWKRIHTERQAGFQTPATAINLIAAGFQNLFLDFEVCQN